VSKENVEIVLELHTAVTRGDLDGVLALAHPEVEYRSAIQQAMEGEGSVFRGLAGIQRWFEELQDLYEYIESEVLEVHDFGERVAIAFVVRGARRRQRHRARAAAGPSGERAGREDRRGVRLLQPRGGARSR
jgi:ketosteroid isomerase-like protein